VTITSPPDDRAAGDAPLAREDAVWPSLLRAAPGLAAVHAAAGTARPTRRAGEGPFLGAPQAGAAQVAHAGHRAILTPAPGAALGPDVLDRAHHHLAAWAALRLERIAGLGERRSALLRHRLHELTNDLSASTMLAQMTDDQVGRPRSEVAAMLGEVAESAAANIGGLRALAGPGPPEAVPLAPACRSAAAMTGFEAAVDALGHPEDPEPAVRADPAVLARLAELTARRADGLGAGRAARAWRLGEDPDGWLVTLGPPAWAALREAAPPDDEAAATVLVAAEAGGRALDLLDGAGEVVGAGFVMPVA
jgi:hypothetical protein